MFQATMTVTYHICSENRQNKIVYSLPKDGEESTDKTENDDDTQKL